MALYQMDRPAYRMRPPKETTRTEQRAIWETWPKYICYVIFFSIRFKVNKGWSTAVNFFFMPLSNIPPTNAFYHPFHLQFEKQGAHNGLRVCPLHYQRIDMQVSPDESVYAPTSPPHPSVPGNQIALIPAALAGLCICPPHCFYELFGTLYP